MLDEILHGGFPAHRFYLIEGMPGTGKTTLGLQFLRDGAQRGEAVLYITLSETVAELNEVAASHGWTLDGIEMFELGQADLALTPEDEQTLLHPWEIELGEVVKLITHEVDRIAPTRIVFDSLSELRLLAQDPLRFRRQILALKQFFAGRRATVLLLDDMSSRAKLDLDLHSLSHGVISMERLTLDFGIVRRRLQVQKLRGSSFREGFHDISLRRGGLMVFPRLVAHEHHREFSDAALSSGLPALDALLGGGPLRGTSTLLTGPAGSGKTTIALQYVASACAQGERCVIYEFDERVGTMLIRAKALGLDLEPHIEAGLLHVKQVDPSEISPGEFTAQVRAEVEHAHARLIVVDSIHGYIAAMPQEKELVLQLHELLSYLNQQGVATFLVSPQISLVDNMNTGQLNIAYVADTVILLRFFEAEGRMRKAISVLKNRANPHEDTIREILIDLEGVRISAPLEQFEGILTGTPTFRGSADLLLDPPDAA